MLLSATTPAQQLLQPGTLYKNVTIDEHGKQVIEFKDKEGQIVLKRVQLTASPDNGLGNTPSGDGGGWICTYYIYDDLNRLRCVIQPEGVKALSQAAVNWQLSSVILQEQCFRYEYDHRNRLIVKKVPGAAEVAMVYDVRDRLVMTQDGNLRTQGIWNYTTYDNLNRSVKTGLAQASNDPNTHWAAAMSKTGDNNAIQYPTTAMLTSATALTETFYDDYSWLSAKSITAINADYTTVHNSYLLTASNTTFPYAQQPAKDSRTKGMVTGTMTNILGTTNYITTLTIYDNKARPIQIKSINQTGGIDLTTIQYSWSGQSLVMVNQQEKKDASPTVTITTVTKNTYDALGRVTQTAKRIIGSGADSGEKVIAQNSYDALGQLKTKQLGSPGTPLWGAGGLQNYEYNIRGWLLGMNRSYVNSAAASTTNKFGFELTYDKQASFGGAGGGLYNGNIATMSWRGQSNSAPIRRYNYSYDAANRIIKADYWQYNGSSFANTQDFNSQMGNGNSTDANVGAYDLNGNILAMTQQGLYNNTKTTIDQLTYSYMPGSNKLLKVKDAQATQYGLGDFNDGTNGSNNDYAYDINGNLTKDANKNISVITYNILNLPETITVTGKGSITYLYDAAGNKLQKKVTEGSTQKTTQYLGGMIFENNVLQHVATEEGRVRLKGSAWAFDYFIKDHLGNVRAMLAENGIVLEETHYYPFGLVQKGISIANPTTSLQNKYKYNGIEENTSFGLNQYDAFYRNLDPQLGRFMQIDPETEAQESFSPYESMGNSPIINVDPLGDFKTKFGAWWHRLWNRDSWKGANIGKNIYGEWYLSKEKPYEGENAGVEITVFYGKGRNAYSTAAEEIVRDQGIMMDIRRNGEASMYQMYDSPKDAGKAALSLGTGVVLPNPIIRNATTAINATKTVQETASPITKNSIIQGLKISNHAWRKSGLGRGATEELISKVINGSKNASTVITETGTGKFSGNVIKVYNHNGIKVAVDETRKIIMSVRPEKGFKLP